MRPVNLIPAEERQGEQSPTRAGPLAYLVVGALVVILLAAAALVLSSNQISERRSELTDLREQAAVARAHARSFDAYSRFHDVRYQRSLTVASLADSRFDWERVVRELSLVLPPDVWLSNLTATGTPAVTIDNDAGVPTRATVPGPALQLIGCAPGQEAVARFVASLHEIDGVSRVGLDQSALAGSETSAGGDSASCQTRNFIAQFQIVVAFDAAPVPPTATGGVSTVPAAPADSTSTSGADPTTEDSSAPASSAVRTGG